MTRRQIAWILILIVDVGFIAWGLTAAVMPDYLLGPGGGPILIAGCEGLSGSAWSELSAVFPLAAGHIEVLFRMYGIFKTFDNRTVPAPR